MKNILFLSSLFLSHYLFCQLNMGEKALKLEIKSTTMDYEIYRKTNDHTSERKEIRREERNEHISKVLSERRQRPNLDIKRREEHIKELIKKESNKDNKKDLRQEKRQEILQQRKERRIGRTNN